MKRLSKQEMYRVVLGYIGVSPSEYLGDLSYRTHQEFYPYFCGLDIDPLMLDGLTTRERFTKILDEATPTGQAKILRGVLAKSPWFPGDQGDQGRTKARYDEIQAMISRLEGLLLVNSPTPRISSEVVKRAIDDAEAH